NTWHNVVLRYDEASHTLDGFLDGVQSAPFTAGIRQTPQQSGLRQYFALGSADFTGNGLPFNGLIDEFAVFNAAIPDLTVTALYAARTGNYRAAVLGANPVAYYRLGESVISDQVTNATGGPSAVYQGVP